MQKKRIFILCVVSYRNRVGDVYINARRKYSIFVVEGKETTRNRHGSLYRERMASCGNFHQACLMSLVCVSAPHSREAPKGFSRNKQSNVEAKASQACDKIEHTLSLEEDRCRDLKKERYCTTVSRWKLAQATPCII